MKIIVLASILLLISCNDDNGDGCLSPEDIADSECPASDLLLVCDPYFCGASFPPDEEHEGIVVDFLLPTPDTECEVIDCTTLDCGALFTDLEINEFGSPTGIVENADGRQATFSSCSVFK